MARPNRNLISTTLLVPAFLFIAGCGSASTSSGISTASAASTAVPSGSTAQMSVGSTSPLPTSYVAVLWGDWATAGVANLTLFDPKDGHVLREVDSTIPPTGSGNLRTSWGDAGTFDASYWGGEPSQYNCGDRMNADFTELSGNVGYQTAGGESGDSVPAVLDLATSAVRILVQPIDHSGFQQVAALNYRTPVFRPTDGHLLALRAINNDSQLVDLTANRVLQNGLGSQASFVFFSASGNAIVSDGVSGPYAPTNPVCRNVPGSVLENTSWQMQDDERLLKGDPGTGAFLATDGSGQVHLMIDRHGVVATGPVLAELSDIKQASIVGYVN